MKRLLTKICQILHGNVVDDDFIKRHNLTYEKYRFLWARHHMLMTTLTKRWRYPKVRVKYKDVVNFIVNGQTERSGEHIRKLFRDKLQRENKDSR